MGGAVKQNNEERERNRGNVKFVEHNSRSILPGGFEESLRASLGTVPLEDGRAEGIDQRAFLVT